jgi:AcrR family transcriptional regulator
MTAEISIRQLEIIEAAGRILTNSGVSGLTIKNLAREMKFSEAALYRHFSSKEEIIIAMLNFLAENMDERYSEVIEGSQTPTEKFAIMFTNQFSFFNKYPHFVVAVFSDGLMEESEGINESIQKIMQIKMKYLEPIITEGQQSGIFTTTVSKDELVQIVMGTFRLQMFKWRLTNFKFDLESQGESMIRALIALMTK